MGLRRGALWGVGSGLFRPAAFAWVGDEVLYESRARVMGRVISGWALARVAAGLSLRLRAAPARDRNRP